MSELYPKLSLRIVYSSSNTIGNHFNFKDKVSKLYMSNIAYEYTCELCQEFYIGKENRMRRTLSPLFQPDPAELMIL